MRAAIGRMELDEILHARAELNAMVTTTLADAAQPWGLDILRYEITEISPDQEIQIAMDKQAVAERERREQVLAAEGLKRAEVLKSEGVKMRLQNESEGDLIRVKNEAEAEKVKILLEAQGEAEAILAKANAQAEAIKIVGEALSSGEGKEAAQLEVAKDFISMYGEMGSKSNTLMMMDKQGAGDVQQLVAQAAAVFDGASKAVGGGASKN